MGCRWPANASAWVTPQAVCTWPARTPSCQLRGLQARQPSGAGQASLVAPGTVACSFPGRPRTQHGWAVGSKSGRGSPLGCGDSRGAGCPLGERVQGDHHRWDTVLILCHPDWTQSPHPGWGTFCLGPLPKPEGLIPQGKGRCSGDAPPFLPRARQGRGVEGGGEGRGLSQSLGRWSGQEGCDLGKCILVVGGLRAWWEQEA